MGLALATLKAKFPKTSRAVEDLHATIDELSLSGGERMVLKARVTSLVLITVEEATDLGSAARKLMTLFAKKR